MNKRLFLTVLTIFLLSGPCATLAQQSKIIDEIKLDDYKILVVFYDPYLNLIEQNSTFKDLDSTKQLEIWDDYLLNHVVYDFQLTQKKKIIKHYIIKGNPTKTIEKLNLPRNTIYQLDIVKHLEGLNYYQHLNYQKEKILTIDKLTYFETLFENMQLIQDEIKAGHEYIAYNFFGRYRMPISYKSIQQSTLSIIADDLYGQIPNDLIAKDNSKYTNSFFDYQQCLSNYHQVDRIEKIYIRRYNKDGSIQDEFPRIEITKDLMHTVNDTSGILNVTTLPFFALSDTAYLVKKTESSFLYKIKTFKDKPIEKYLEDIIVTKNLSNEIEKIEAIRLIHASSIDGDFVIKENYIAYFKKFDNCVLPYKILASEKDDVNFTKPNSIIELDYLFYRK